MKFKPYLSFAGDCQEAFSYYEKHLGGKIKGTFNWKDTPAAQHVPANWGDKVMHSTIAIGDQELLGADVPPDQYKPSQGFHVAIDLKDVGTAETVFKALSEKGTVQMPIGETFWAQRFGMVVDQFGIPWMVNCEKSHQN